MVHVFAEIAWDPEIRNILGLCVGIGVLVGSIMLIVSTNTGPRTGMLIVLGCLFGWMSTMGAFWWMYGIGMKGEASHWRVVEINTGDLSTAENAQAKKLPAVDDQAYVDKILGAHPELKHEANPEDKPDKVYSISELVELMPSVRSEFHLTPSDLGGWRILNPSDKQRGDAQAVADAALVAANEFGTPTTSGDYKVIEAYDIGGKRPLPADTGDCRVYSPGTFDDCKTRIWDDINTAVVQFTHPEHFAVVQVRQVVKQETVPGQAPPTPKFDETKPVVTVVMIRSLGDLRFPGFMVFIGFGTLFGLTCNALHRRDKLQAAHRAAAG
ncbi:MAG: hypothetical protein ACR2LQ_06255 [Acidimicrobiales bacterium]